MELPAPHHAPPIATREALHLKLPMGSGTFQVILIHQVVCFHRALWTLRSIMARLLSVFSGVSEVATQLLSMGSPEAITESTILRTRTLACLTVELQPTDPAMQVVGTLENGLDPHTQTLVPQLCEAVVNYGNLRAQ